MKNMWLSCGEYCALDLCSLNTCLSSVQILKVLAREGFIHRKPNLLEHARSRIEHSLYQVGCAQRDAPDILNCTSFIAWCYAQIGIGVSRKCLSIFGREVWDGSQQIGDLVFVSDPTAPSGGHVGMATGPDTIIHAQKNVNVQEISFEQFLGKEKLRKVVRIVPDWSSVVTIMSRREKEIFCSADFASILRRALKEK